MACNWSAWEGLYTGIGTCALCDCAEMSQATDHRIDHETGLLFLLKTDICRNPLLISPAATILILRGIHACCFGHGPNS